MFKSKLILTKLLITVVLTLGVSISFQSLLADWAAPNVAPPNDNLGQPIDTSATSQGKIGDLQIGGNLLVDLGTLAVDSVNNRVGIGNGSPVVPLHIGAAPNNYHASDQLLLVSGSPQIEFEDIDGTDYWMHINSDSLYFLWDENDDGTWAGDEPWPLYFQGRDSYFGGNIIKTTAPAAGTERSNGLYVWTDRSFGMELIFTGGRWATGIFARNDGSDIVFGGYPADETEQQNFVEYMAIDTGTGNVGIGTVAPQDYAALEVNTTGSKSIYTMDSASGGLLIGYAGTNIQARTTAHGNTANLLLQQYGGNVGIGDASPNAKLDVAGNIKVGSNSAVCDITHAGEIRWTGSDFEGCDGSGWASLTDSGPTIDWLVNELHTENGCTSSGGTVVTDGVDMFCRFASNSCPGGWFPFNDWTVTTNRYCVDPNCPAGGCNTGFHSTFSNTPAETCLYVWEMFYNCGAPSIPCTANTVETGCY